MDNLDHPDLLSFRRVRIWTKEEREVLSLSTCHSLILAPGVDENKHTPGSAVNVERFYP